ncbi:hypothetical protein K438DRAFT_1747142 [Mycena galopus ATCC 62051]|nr:hypothetical protein K438DRAFT_1747142 [Mycena galopus ATCC 62051]
MFSGFTGLESAPVMRKDITKILKNGLVLACKRTKCTMNYKRYMRVIVLGYGVILVGWPKSVEFTSLTNICSIDDLQMLYEALKDGTCRWKVLTAAEKEKRKKEYEEKIALGEIVEQARKEHRDKGEERGSNSRTQGKRAAGEKSKSKSKAMVKDSDKEEESNQEEEDEEDEEEEEDEEPVTKKTCGSKSASKQKEKEESQKGGTKRKRDNKDGDEGEDEEGRQSKKARRSAGETRKRPREDNDEEEEEVDCRLKKTVKPTVPIKSKPSTAAKSKPSTTTTTVKASVKVKTSTAAKPKPLTSDATRPKPTPAYRNASGSKSGVNDTPNQEKGSDIQAVIRHNRDAATEAAVAQDIARRKGAEASAAIEAAGALAAVGEISAEAQVAAHKTATDLDTAAKAVAARAAILTAKPEKVATETAHLRNSLLPSASNSTSSKNTVKGKKGGPPGMRGNA